MTIVLSIILRMSNISFVSENGTFGFLVPNCVKSSMESGGLFASLFPVPVTTLLQLSGKKSPNQAVGMLRACRKLCDNKNSLIL